MRPANSIHSVVAKPMMKNPRLVPNRLKNRTGRRPYLSESLPSTGVKMSCMAE